MFESIGTMVVGLLLEVLVVLWLPKTRALFFLSESNVCRANFGNLFTHNSAQTNNYCRTKGLNVPLNHHSIPFLRVK